MDLPPWVPFPPASLRREIVPQEWEACLDAWIALAHAYLLLPSEVFRLKSTKDGSLISFLSTYLQEVSRAPHLDIENIRFKTLRQDCFLLAHRVLADVEVLPPSIDWIFLGNLSIVYAKRRAIRELVDAACVRKELEQGLQKFKKSLVSELEKSGSEGSENSDDTLRRLCALIHASANVGHFLMIGTDFMDALISAHRRASAGYQKKLVTLSYLGLTCLTEGDKPNISLLLDHMYSLKSSGGTESKDDEQHVSLASVLVTDTPLLRKLQDRVRGGDASRLKPIISALETLRSPLGSRRKRLVRRKIDKGKARDHDEYGHGAFNDIHVHRMSLVTQVQDLFPSLGSAFILKLLDEYNEDVEQVTAHLLEDSLPPHLRDADRTEQIPHTNTQPTTTTDLAPHLAPRPTPPLSPTTTIPTRHNIFDSTPDLALLPPTSNLHIGRANTHLTADTLLSHPPPSTAHKAAILSALAAFDSDDDERDDTYDVADVGGTVEPDLDANTNARDDENKDNNNKEDDVNEEALFNAYKMSPAVFGRDSATRRGAARAALKSETGMTDEAIEGWGVMLGRDGRRMRWLEARFGGMRGGQRELVGTAWRGGAGGGGGSGTEESDVGGSGAARAVRGGGRGRGRGRGGGRGGSVAGPADDKSTQVARQRKDANKASRANHNRRDQRARKMGRGGFAA